MKEKLEKILEVLDKIEYGSDGAFDFVKRHPTEAEYEKALSDLRELIKDAP